MRGLVIVALVILLLLVVVGGSLAGTYNRLVQASQQVDQSWANVETQYQRRFDLIPNLVEATKGFLQQERAIFGQIAEARTRYAGARTPSERVEAANQLEGALARLLVIVENYPTLRSSETVQRLMAELAGTENEIAFARRAYNQTVLQYNTLVKTFPTNLVAGFLGFRERPFFQAQPGAERAPRIDLTIPQQTKP
ncbi:MAG: LemA family protein [Armatimonadota bacterium]|nr:LemA family protein [Armatimonadota bacterium]MDR5703908.1 LemA family protein [Armatimonadota bacterium]MDR7435200.1 LemA family protein [Armatimonadota bacterium]